MKNRLLFILIFLPFLASSQPGRVAKLTEASPESAGMSGERIALIEDMCKKLVAEENLPGMVTLIARNGKIVHHKAYGVSSESGRKLKKDDIFRIASQSKAITSTAVMMLWEEGRFRLDDPISRYIPEFTDPRVLTGFVYGDTTYQSRPASREIRIRDLLNHTSGIGYGVIDGDERMRMIYAKAGIVDLYTTKGITIEENIKRLAKLPLHHDPGTKFTYSEGLDVLGYFVEVVSGMKFDEFLRKRLFDPLGMEDTWFYLPGSKQDRLVEVLHKSEGKWKKYPDTFYDTDYPKEGAMTFFSGGAGLSSTALDYAKFLQMYLNGGEYNGVRILSKTTIRTIMANQLGSTDMWGDQGRYYGLAFGVVNEKGVADGGRGSAGTFSWGGYFNTQYYADPKENVIGIIMKQTQGSVSDPTGWMFWQMTMASVND